MNTSRLSRLFYRFALVLVLGMIAVLPGQSAPDWEALQTAVVKIKAVRGNVSGTGCLIKIEGNRGYILTAYHVIQSAVAAGQQGVMVEFYRRLGALEGIIVNDWIQTDNDLAVLVVENVPVQYVLFFGTTEGLRKRDEVTAIGHPEGSPWAIKDGKVSNFVGRDVHFSGDAVDPGNSGGPLLNTQGQIVGMNIRVLGKTGVAIQSDVIKPIVRNWIGELPVTHVLVPEGWFEMGSNDGEDDEKPVHRVWLDTFYMDKYEVTVGEYTVFLRATGRQGLPDYVATYAPGGQYPVVGVSWDDAEAYCRWAGKQLPTEAQWEKAARGTDRRQYPWGNESVDGKRANYDAKADGYEYTAPVGSFPSGKSPYGIEDLAGNVWEWVQDWYTADYYRRSPERNPVNDTPAQDRVLRGGGWRNPPANVRSAYRGRGAPGNRDNDIGFRCVVRGAALRP